MKKKCSFEGQKMIVLSRNTVNKLLSNVLTKDSHVTDIGYFPRAKYHFRRRKNGSMHNILIYCVDGWGCISVDGVESKLCKDHYYIIPKLAPHTYMASETDPWSIYWIHFDGDKAKQLIEKYGMSKKSQSADSKLLEERIRLFDGIFYNLENENAESNQVFAGSALMMLLCSFILEPQFRRIRDIRQEDVAGKAIGFMKANLGRKLCLAELALYCNLSVSHFCLEFKKRTSYTPVEYLNNLRVQQACQMLDLTNMKVNEIAYRLGFSDSFYFSRVFRKVIGYSPTAYRKQISG